MTDIIAEKYGEKSANITVWSGFIAIVLYFVYTYIVVAWPPVSYWGNQEQFEQIVGSSLRITVAGIIAFLVSQFLDVKIFAVLRARHGRSKLAVRNIASTVVSQTVDTLIFITIAFYGVFPIIDLIWGTIVVKIIIALLDTPFVYLARSILDSGSKSLDTAA